MITKKETAVIFIMAVIFVFLTRNYYFFGDNIVQTAVPALFYYDTGFTHFYLPNEITTGHQPFFGMYLAAGWKILGKSIAASHFLLLPFIFGIGYQLLRFLRFFIKDYSASLIIFGICLADSVLLSQLSLITFEIPHIFFFLATLNTILRKEKLWGAVFFALLNLVSLRASMSAIGIGLFFLMHQIFIEKKFRIKEFWIFVPGALVFFAFLYTFYLDHGWIVHNSVSKSWEQSSQPANFKGIIRNIIIFIWRLADFGRIIFYLMFFWIIFRFIKDKTTIDCQFLILFLVAFSQFLVFFANTIPYQNSIAHRYLLPISIIFTIAVGYWFHKNSKSWKPFLAMLAFTISGYWWIYPEKIAKGWDSMPSLHNYYGMRQSAINFMKKNKIDINSTGTGFPNTRDFEGTELGNPKLEFKDWDINKDLYIFYSNVFNAPDSIIDRLYSKEFSPVYKAEDGFVKVIIFKRKK